MDTQLFLCFTPQWCYGNWCSSLWGWTQLSLCSFSFSFIFLVIIIGGGSPLNKFIPNISDSDIKIMANYVVWLYVENVKLKPRRAACWYEASSCEEHAHVSMNTYVFMYSICFSLCLIQWNSACIVWLKSWVLLLSGRHLVSPYFNLNQYYFSPCMSVFFDQWQVLKRAFD